MIEECPATDQHILTLRQAAAHLQIAVKTCGELARRGRIPAFKLGRQWRFIRQELEAWATAQAAANVRPQSNVAATLGSVRAKPRVSTASLAERLQSKLDAMGGKASLAAPPDRASTSTGRAPGRKPRGQR